MTDLFLQGAAPELSQVAELAAAVRQLAHSLEPRPSAFTLPDGLAVVGSVVALATFIAGLWQYRRAQRVERAKFAITAVDQFENDRIVQNATLMLDWNGRRIRLKEDRESPMEVDVTHAMLAKALRTRELTFTYEEAAIRDTFDHFFHQLARFENLIRNRLISAHDLRPYLSYWCEALAGTKSFTGRVYVDPIREYMTAYGFEDSLKLVERFTRHQRELPQPVITGKWEGLSEAPPGPESLAGPR